MRCTLILFLFFCTRCMGQHVKWTDQARWDDVVKKATAEGKYIFVDCYATWCGPCKAMDLEVYTNPKVGLALNDKFISVRLQFDQTPADSKLIKGRYADVELFKKQYSINLFPTLLFFSSNGVLLHRLSQGLGVEGFLELVASATDPTKQYATLLSKYETGQRDTAFLRTLSKATKEARNMKLSAAAAGLYIQNLTATDLYDDALKSYVKEYSMTDPAQQVARKYIDMLDTAAFFTIPNIEFVREFTKRSTDKGFAIYNNNASRINRIMDTRKVAAGGYRFTDSSDYAESLLREIIYREQITDGVFRRAISESVRPDWDKVTASIQAKYPHMNVKLMVADAKVSWYSFKKEWQPYCEALLSKLTIRFDQRRLLGKTFEINNICWEIFLHSSDSTILQNATQWMDKTFGDNPQDLQWTTGIDTYANLLYKTGRVTEAIKWEEQAFKLAPNDTSIKICLDKMRNKIPTW